VLLESDAVSIHLYESHIVVKVHAALLVTFDGEMPQRKSGDPKVLDAPLQPKREEPRVEPVMAERQPVAPAEKRRIEMAKLLPQLVAKMDVKIIMQKLTGCRVVIGKYVVSPIYLTYTYMYIFMSAMLS
jgi:hypothetical protein